MTRKVPGHRHQRLCALLHRLNKKENNALTVSDYELIWVTILIMGLLGLLFDLAMRWVISRLIPWRGRG